MWVEVLAQGGDGGALGRLRNRPLRLTELEIGDEVAFGAHEVLSIDYSDEELGYPQDQWPIVDRAVLDDDRAPDVVVRYESPRDEEPETWWMLVHKSGSGPADAGAGRLTDRFPGLAEPLRAGTGVWDARRGRARDGALAPRRRGRASPAASGPVCSAGSSGRSASCARRRLRPRSSARRSRPRAAARSRSG